MGKGEPGWQKSRCKRIRTSPVISRPMQAKQPSKFGIKLHHPLKFIRLFKKLLNYFSVFNAVCVAINRIAVCGRSRAGLPSHPTPTWECKKGPLNMQTARMKSPQKSTMVLMVTVPEPQSRLSPEAGMGPLGEPALSGDCQQSSSRAGAPSSPE